AKDYIKRVIALPGDTIRVVYDEVYVNGELIDEPYLKEAIEQEHAQGKTYNSTNFKVVNGEVVSVQVPEDHIFVMGDNRSKSRDSRMESVGFVPLEEVVGRVDVVFWPPQAFKIVDHGKK